MRITMSPGDSLQLPTLLASSLVDHSPGHRGANSPDMYSGWLIYKSVTDCVMLHANKRRHDRDLASLLNIIR